MKPPGPIDIDASADLLDVKGLATGGDRLEEPGGMRSGSQQAKGKDEEESFHWFPVIGRFVMRFIIHLRFRCARTFVLRRALLSALFVCYAED